MAEAIPGSGAHFWLHVSGVAFTNSLRRTVRHDPKRKMLMVGSSDKKLHLISTETWSEFKALECHTGTTQSLFKLTATVLVCLCCLVDWYNFAGCFCL